MSESIPSERWSDYKRRRTTALLMLIGVCLLTGLMGLAIRRLSSSRVVVVLAIIVAAIGYILFTVAIARFWNWKCPRCGGRFIGTYYIFSFVRRKCAYCRLVVGTAGT